MLADTYTDGFLVLHDGRVVTEQYPTGMPADRTHMLMSVSKSLVGCVVGMLADQGAIDVTAAGGLLHPRARRVRLPRRHGPRRARHAVRDHVLRGVPDPAAEVRLLEQVIGWAPRARPDLPTSMYEYLATLPADRAARHGVRVPLLRDRHPRLGVRAGQRRPDARAAVHA